MESGIDVAMNMLCTSLQAVSDRFEARRPGFSARNTIERPTTSTQVPAFAPVLGLLFDSYLSVPVVPAQGRVSSCVCRTPVGDDLMRCDV